jgi:hypothetical protein
VHDQLKEKIAEIEDKIQQLEELKRLSPWKKSLLL